MIHIIAIDRIEIGERRREDMGDLAGLAESIQKYGLLHPIVIAEGKLVAGARRLTACRDILEWATIPAQNFGDLTEEEIREIELEENLRRKDLTPFEEAKEMVRQAERIAPVISANLAEKDPRGRKSEAEVPKEDIAQALGTSRSDLRRAEQHVETADQFPIFQSPSRRDRTYIG